MVWLLPTLALAGGLPDTGITAKQCFKVGSNVLVKCASAGAQALSNRQDGMLGRDVDKPGAGDGKLGFSYLKIAADGNKLDPSASDWACVKDKITGLMWELKTADGGLRDLHQVYTNWGDGRPGDASAYVVAVNASGLCGYRNWRLPTADELHSLVDYGADYNNGQPAIDTAWFPRTVADWYWASSPYAGGSAGTWYVNFFAGFVDYYHGSHDDVAHVRLVR